jgi:hypothetical protein
MNIIINLKILTNIVIHYKYYIGIELIIIIIIIIKN